MQVPQHHEAVPITSLSGAPQESLSGNTLVQLDRGRELRAYALYLEQASDIFRGALRCQQGPETPEPRPNGPGCPLGSQGAPAITHHLPLPGASMCQALLLLHCLYAFDRGAWAEGLCGPDLLELACIADKFACTAVLRLVDSTLVKRCTAQEGAGGGGEWAPPCLIARNAPEQHGLARKLHLTGFEARVGCFLGMHADEIDLTQVDAGLAHVLRGANRVRAELLASMCRG